MNIGMNGIITTLGVLCFAHGLFWGGGALHPTTDI